MADIDRVNNTIDSYYLLSLCFGNDVAKHVTNQQISPCHASNHVGFVCLVLCPHAYMVNDNGI